MSKKSISWLGLIGLGVLSISLIAQNPPGPPQFIGFPLLTHVGEDGLDHGHFVFSEGAAASPSPLYRLPPPGDYSPAAKGASSVSPTLSEATVSTGTDSSYEGETAAAFNGSVMVAGSNHIYPGACNASAASGATGDCAPYAYRSTDGSSWSKTALTRVWNGTTFGIGFDPAIDTDKAGNFYYTYGVAPLSGNYPNAIVIAKSTNGGANWSPLTPVTYNRNRFFDDKYYLAIDRSNGAFANRIYVSWDRNSSNNQTLYVSSSSNGGSSWSSPIKVNDGATSFERVIGAYPAVDQATGVVYDSWHDYAKNIIFVDKSSNGAVSWGKDVAAASTHAGFGVNIGCVGGRSQGPAHSLKVGPSGKLHLVYADPVAGRGFDVLYTQSSDGGAHWSAPVSVNDDATARDQFHPTLSVESNGTGGDKVTVSFYDRREDAGNCLAHVYQTQSLDSGATWAANVKKTVNASNFDGNANGPGDYSSSSPGFSSVFPFHSSHPVGSPSFDVITTP
jgi:hypothetical protein